MNETKYLFSKQKSFFFYIKIKTEEFVVQKVLLYVLVRC